MFYKRPGGRSTTPETGARWSNYGDPGALYAGRAAAAVSDYAYLLWNLPRTPGGVLHGGGIVRAVIAAGQAINLCARTSHLVLPAFDSAGRPDGQVESAYAAIRLRSGAAVFGWVVVGYAYHGHRHRLTT
jgi:hypothetical protein